MITAPIRMAMLERASQKLWMRMLRRLRSLRPRTRRSEEHTSELQSLAYLVCRLLLEKKKNHRESGDTPQGKVGDVGVKERVLGGQHEPRGQHQFITAQQPLRGGERDPGPPQHPRGKT